MIDFWDNAELFPFLWKDGKLPQFLRYIGIDGIDWQEEKAELCGYCGSARVGAVCSNCGSPAPGKTVHSLGKAIATLYGPMPEAASIFYLPTGATIDIVWRRCGPPDKYMASDVVLRLLGCKVVGRSLPNLIAIDSGARELIRLYVSIECEVELYPDGLEGDRGSCVHSGAGCCSAGGCACDS